MSTNYSVLIGITISLLTFIWTIYQYIDSKKRDQDLKEFENFHRLIKELVQPENNGMYVDRQAAIIYEMRHFKRYYAYSYRTLISLREKWSAVPGQFPRLIDELDRTIEFLKNTKQQRQIQA